jgi:fused signal recognition particle receptor
MDLSPEIVIGATVVAAAAATLTVLLLRRRRRPRVAGSPPPVGAAAAAAAATARPTPLGRLRESLGQTREGLVARLRGAWGAGRDVGARLEAIEEVLIGADVGVKATQALLAKLRLRPEAMADADSMREALRDEMRLILADDAETEPVSKPCVILVVGVNGVGKTTTIGKLAHRYRQLGKKVLVVAADTFRAAAAEQLVLWADRVGVDCVRHQSGADPSAVAFDGMNAALARGVDLVIVDTAGRLHVKAHLIDELKKIARVIGRQVEGAPQEVWLVIDATTGQNAINQARVFQEALSLTGLVLTKLDGTAKGGAVVAIRAELDVPIRYIGLGETPTDLVPFDATAFVDAILAPRAPEHPRPDLVP